MSTKDTLARILARENIVIKHSNKGEASFNPKKRILTLPIYDKNIDENTYDLMIGTGAGQALYGPSSKEIFENALPKISKDTAHAKKVLTVMDGIRTEKLVRGRYAGLSRIFNEAYKQMIIGLKINKIDFKTLNILDRLNLAFKMGVSADVPFTKEEQRLVDLTSKMKTFGDAVIASRELLKFVEPDPPQPPSPCDESDEDQEPQESDEKSESQNKGKSKSDKDQNEENEEKQDKSDQKDDKKQDKSKSDKKDEKDQKDSEDKDKENSGKDDKQKQDQKDDKDDKQDSDKSDQGKDKQDKQDDKKDQNKSDKDKKEQDKDEGKENSSASPESDKKDENNESGEENSEGQGKDEEGEDKEGESSPSDGANDSGANDEGGEEESEDQPEGNSSPAQGNAKLDGPDISSLIASHMQDLIDDRAVAPVVGYMPDKLDPDAFIVPYQQFFNICSTAYDGTDQTAARDWMKASDSTVSYMVSEFERKKRAALYVRRKTAKTGVIDTNKLVHALYSDDIFKRNTTVPEGRNHGMTFYLDWSGSMASITPGTIDQLLNLVLFCRRARIPHEGYLFTDQTNSELKRLKSRNVNKFGPEEIMPIDDLSLIQVFTDQMTATEFMLAVTYLYNIKTAFLTSYNKYTSDGNPPSLPEALYQSSTPLDSTLIVSAYINDRLRERCKLEIVKSCIITDGASNAGMYMMNHNMTRTSLNAAESIQDRRTGTILKVNGTIAATGMMAELAAKRSNADYYGFYLIGDASSISNLVKKYKFENKKNTNLVAEFIKKKFVVVENFGFKEYYIINPIQVKDLNVNAQNSLSKVLNQRAQDRVMLARFMEQIADTNA